MAESIRLRILKLLRQRLEEAPEFEGAHLLQVRDNRAFEDLPCAVISWGAGDHVADPELEQSGYQQPGGRVLRQLNIAIAIKGFHEPGAADADPNEKEWTDEAMDPLLQAVERVAAGLNLDPEFLAIFNAVTPTGDGKVLVLDCIPDPTGDRPGAPFMGSAVLVRAEYRQSAADPAVP